MESGKMMKREKNEREIKRIERDQGRTSKPTVNREPPDTPAKPCIRI